MKVNRVTMLIAPLAIALCALSGPAHAQRGNGPCRQDIEKLCPGTKPGGGAFRSCLEQHTSELSPACQDHLKQMNAKAATWRQACQDDVQKFCAQVDPGHGNIMRCLHQHHDELSQTCKDQMAQHRRSRGRRASAPTPGSAPSSQ